MCFWKWRSASEIMPTVHETANSRPQKIAKQAERAERGSLRVGKGWGISGWVGVWVGGIFHFDGSTAFPILTQLSFGIQGGMQRDINLRKSAEKLGHLWAIHFTPTKQISNLKWGKRVKGDGNQEGKKRGENYLIAEIWKRWKKGAEVGWSVSLILIAPANVHSREKEKWDRRAARKEAEKREKLFDRIWEVMKVADLRRGGNIHCEARPQNGR